MSNATKITAELRHDGQLLHVLLDDPKANILDSVMMNEMVAALDTHAVSPILKGIVFEGSGKHFSFGASVEEHKPAQVASMLAQFHGLFHKLAELSVPTFAIVRGQCLGGGLELASYCSRIFADTKAYFGQPEIKLAVIPPMASVLLPWRTGGANALDLCVSGRSIGAPEALRIGLVQDVGDDPAAAFEAYFSENFLPLSASSLRYAERAARLGLHQTMKQDIPQLERMYVEELMKTPDANEGITAFLEKRAPSYTGAS